MRSLVTLGAALVVTGCASSQVPPQTMADTKAAVRAANEVGAESIPQGQLHLKMARDQIALAESYLRDDEEDLAKAALDRARQDAELALAMAKEAQAKQAALEARRKVDELRGAAGTGAPVTPPSQNR